MEQMNKTRAFQDCQAGTVPQWLTPVSTDTAPTHQDTCFRVGEETPPPGPRVPSQKRKEFTGAHGENGGK